MKSIEVVAAIIINDGKFFATQRGYGSYKDWWEFPGGKIEENESKEAALIREIKEEPDTFIAIKHELGKVEYDYPDFHLSMYCSICEVVDGALILKEHESSKWLSYDELESVDWLPADIIAVKMLKDYVETGFLL